MPAAAIDPLITLQHRNDLEVAELQRLTRSKVTKDITAPELVRKLRYIDPRYPTDTESKLIPAFKDAFPSISADFTSFQANPGCSCASKISQVLIADPQKTQATLDTVYPKGLFRFLATATPRSQLNGIAGTAVIIPAEPAAWTRYFDDLLRTKAGGSSAIFKTLYTGVHVKDVDEGKKWLLLFY